MSQFKTVFVVDDDAEVRASICALLTSLGCHCTPAASAEEFLAHCPPDVRGVLVADLRMPGMSGLELQEELARRHLSIPIIILTAYARTSTTVTAMQRGAFTILDKPHNEEDLWNAVRSAFEVEDQLFAARQRQQDVEARFAALTDDERRVVELMIQGVPNKAIVKALGISLRTVEKRRHDIFAKTRTRSVAELVELCIAVQQFKSAQAHERPPER
jgi:FixJ family two-component response regulator